MKTIAVATPSRGMIHSRTVDAVIRAVLESGLEFLGWSITHDLPIPTSHEQVCMSALESGADYVWLVEEDVVPPTNAVSLMLEAISQQLTVGAFIDYPISWKPTYNCAKITSKGTLVWCGNGCLLLDRIVFERLERPWFESTNEVDVRVDGEIVSIRSFPKLYDYGGQDINFSLKVYQSGMRIAYVDPVIAICDHLYLETWGMQGTNKGVHKVLYRPRPERRI